jgi:hypothetical protein
LNAISRYCFTFFIFLLWTGTVFGASFDPQKAEFEIRVKTIISPYKIMSFSVLPEEMVPIEILSGNMDKEILLSANTGFLKALSNRLWTWKAPKNAGTYQISVLSHDNQCLMTLHFFVIIPYASVKNEKYINGYQIGSYPDVPLKNLPIYLPPAGFIEVTPNNISMKVSPHFDLSQFICKQNDGFPKYMVLQTRLLLKLELILEYVNKNGYQCDTFHVMSGYRTPFYNRSIGNVKYSRHVWGGAADIFIDESPKNNYMDDLNKDGLINWKDAEVLYDMVDALYGKPFYQRLIGGLGWYRKTAAHGPFVHVDVRGHRARWGD